MCEGRAEAEFAILARNFIAFSKPKNLRPDREFESYLVRQLVRCFCREISPPEILTQDPRVSLTQFDANYHRERSLETADAPLASNSPFGNLAVRLDRGLGCPNVLCAITGIDRNGVPSGRLLRLSAI